MPVPESQLRLNTAVLHSQAYAMCSSETYQECKDADIKCVPQLHTHTAAVSCHGMSTKTPNNCTVRLLKLFRTWLWRFAPLRAVKDMHLFFFGQPGFSDTIVVPRNVQKV